MSYEPDYDETKYLIQYWAKELHENPLLIEKVLPILIKLSKHLNDLK